MSTPGQALHVLRAALARGPLKTRRALGGHYVFGRRRFSAVTVNRLIASGEAVRRPDGSIIRAERSPGADKRDMVRADAG